MKRKTRGYWTKEKCQKEALKYKKRSIFKSGSGGAYNFAKDNKFLNEICGHMEIIGNRFRRLVYVYEFSDKHIYVGLTYDIEKRNNKHMRDVNSSVYQHFNKTKSKPLLTYSHFMDVNDAIILEGETVEKYKKNGHIILNKTKTGAVGGENIKWTFEKCLLEAKNYNSRTEFARKSESAYNASRRYEWMDKICSHMPIVNTKPLGYWTKEKCKKEALKFKTKNMFYKKSGGAYGASFRNGWLNEICTHMVGKIKKPNGYWNKKRCLNEAKKYNLKNDFRMQSASAYFYSLKNNWIKEIYSCIESNKE